MQVGSIFSSQTSQLQQSQGMANRQGQKAKMDEVMSSVADELGISSKELKSMMDSQMESFKATATQGQRPPKPEEAITAIAEELGVDSSALLDTMHTKMDELGIQAPQGSGPQAVGDMPPPPPPPQNGGQHNGGQQKGLMGLLSSLDDEESDDIFDILTSLNQDGKSQLKTQLDELKTSSTDMSSSEKVDAFKSILEELSQNYSTNTTYNSSGYSSYSSAFGVNMYA